jgi:choline dehydrogenase-like flavoprotein
VSRPPLVIGSGPSGVAAAAALIACGLRPLIVDAGEAAGSRAEERRRAARDPTKRQQVHFRADESHRDDPGRKSWFGSDHSFTQPEGASIEYDAALVARASFGVGGMSRVWGGTFAFADLSRWPSGCRPSDLDRSVVRALVPSSTTAFSNGKEVGSLTGLQASSAARTLRMKFDRGVRSDQWSTQSSSIAIDSRVQSDTGCVLCGLCLSGCPMDSIWCAGDQIAAWVMDGSVNYMPGVLVDRLEESERRVTMYGVQQGRSISIDSDRVYLAAGPLGSAAILLRSGMVAKLTVRDTAIAFAAVLDISADHAFTRSHALSQWWISSSDGLFSAQMYAPDANHAARLAAQAHIPLWAAPALRGVARRLHPMIAYLDPSLSRSMTVSLNGGQVRVNGADDATSYEALRSYARDLARSFRRAGAYLPVSTVRASAPGSGYHSGSSLPHGRGSDYLGRPPGLQRVHVVDATVLPEVRVGSVTPTIMANAHRIAREVTSGCAG